MYRYMFLFEVLHLSVAIRGGGGGTLGTYAGMARDLSTLCDNFKPEIGGLDCFCTSAGSRWEDLWDL